MISITDIQQKTEATQPSDSCLNSEDDHPFKLQFGSDFPPLDQCDNQELDLSSMAFDQSLSMLESPNDSSLDLTFPSNDSKNQSLLVHLDDSIYLEVSIMEQRTKHTQMASFIVPANNLLSDLADAFDCPSDHIVVNEEKDPGRFFFFENVFYNDTAVDQDLSQYILIINY
jgi:hypothetical protein